MPQLELNNWTIIRLLCTKNWNVLRNGPAAFFFTILSPASFIMILVLLRIHVGVKEIPAKDYKPVRDDYWEILLANNTLDAESLRNYTDGTFNYNVYIPRNCLAWAPNDSNEFASIMDKAATKLNSVNTTGFKTSESLHAAMEKEHYLAGIVFTRSETFDFTLVYPSEIRDYWDNIIGSHWRTNDLHDPFYRHLERNPSNDDGGYVGYFREGLVAIQKAIYVAYITTVKKKKEADLPKVNMNRFAIPKTTYDPFLENMNCCLSLAIMIGYLYPTMRFITIMVREKSLLLKDALYIFGVTEMVQFVAWFIHGLVHFFLASIISVVLLKIHFAESGSFGILSNSSWTLLLVYMLAYNVASVCFCYLVGTFFQHPSGAIVMHSIIWTFTYLPYSVSLFRIDEWNRIVFVLVGLFSNTAMAMGIKQVIDLEKSGSGVNFANVFEPNEHDKANLAVGVVTLILFGQAVAYALIGLIVEINKKKTWLKDIKNCFKLRQLCSFIRNNFSARRSTEEGTASLQYYGSETSLSKSQSLTASSKKISSVNSMKSGSSFATKARLLTEVVEVESMNKKTVVDIKNICLIIDNIKVVNDVSMQLYEGEINVLLGANGSGKSMLLSMIIGRVPATRGAIVINGVDIANISNWDHSFVGVSLSDDMLYPELTVSDQITFFSSMKGYSGERLRVDVKKYLIAMNLSSKAHLVTSTLTQGVKQHLCACCALCGGSKFVILNQPSSAMDMSATKLFWDLLLKEKRGRTILIATHSIDEAEILGDRIGIMTNGKLKCFGSQFFLKSMYGTGKRLNCAKDVNCNVNTVTKFISKYIPKISLESDLCNELSYKIIGENTDTLVNLLSKIEKHLKKLKLHSFTITELTFEDIFLYMCEGKATEGASSAQMNRLMNGFPDHLSEYESLFLRRKDDKQSIMKEMLAVYFKRWYYMKGNILGTILQFVLPVLVIYLSISLPSSDLGSKELNPMTYTLTQYKKSISVTTVQNEADKNQKNIRNNYKDIIEKMGTVHEHRNISPTQDLDNYIKEVQSKSHSEGGKHLIGATFDKNKVTAWFNNYPLHTVPLSLNVAYNSILHLYDKSEEFSVTLEPLRSVSILHPDQLLIDIQLSNIVVFYVAFVMCTTCAIAVTTIITERVSTFKLLQYINGLKPTAYLIANISYNMMKVIIIGVIIITMTKITKRNEFEMEISTQYIMVLTFFAFGMWNFTYCISSFFNNPQTGSIAVLLFTVYSGVLFVMIKEIYKEKYTYNITIDEKYIWCFRILPVFAFCNSLNRIAGSATHRRFCNDTDIFLVSTVLKECKVAPDCCTKPDVLKWNNPYSIIPDIICMLAFGVISMIVFFFFEYNSEFRVSRISYRNKKNESLLMDGFSQMSQKAFALIVNATVAHEKHAVVRLQPQEYQTKPLVMYNVGKSHNRVIAVHQLYLKIEKGECFGILGINGSGKTTVINLLTGHEVLTAGEIYVEGIRMKTDVYDMYKNIGLCPKPYAIPDNFIVYEVMKLLCILRGIPNKNILGTCEGLAKTLGFIQFLYMSYGILSSGNKLRVCTAISMIGSPTIMYYDTLTSGIDPAGRRVVWNMFGRMLKMGKSVLFTTLNANECARVCTRIAILNDGTFQYLDTPHNLSHNYMVGSLLYVQVITKYVQQRSRQSEESGNTGDDLISHQTVARLSITAPSTSSIVNPFLKVQTFVENTFRNAIVKDQRGRVIIFFIPGDTSLSEIYLQMGRNAFNLNVAHFSLTRTTLEMLFCDLTDQNEPSGSMDLY